MKPIIMFSAGPGKMFLLAIVFTLFFVSCSTHRHPGGENAAMGRSKAGDVPCILIVSDKKGLEWNVAGYLERYYSKKKYLVRNILFTDFSLYKGLDHTAVILLILVKNGRIHSDIEPYIQLKGDEGRDAPVFFISSISGGEWDREHRLVDGISGASEMADAISIAARIIRTIDSRMD